MLARYFCPELISNSSVNSPLSRPAWMTRIETTVSLLHRSPSFSVISQAFQVEVGPFYRRQPVSRSLSDPRSESNLPDGSCNKLAPIPLFLSLGQSPTPILETGEIGSGFLRHRYTSGVRTFHWNPKNATGKLSTVFDFRSRLGVPLHYLKNTVQLFRAHETTLYGQDGSEFLDALG